MADAESAHIIATPSMTYDATATGPVSGWVKCDSGPADMQGHASGDWPDSAPWRQT